jgi:transcriptional regulator with XRE-family HTH domain
MTPAVPPRIPNTTDATAIWLAPPRDPGRFGPVIGTGGAPTIPYLVAVVDRGYCLFQFTLSNPPSAMLAPKTAAEKLARIRKLFVPAMTDLALLLRVSRQAVYDWLNGKEIAADNLGRIDQLYKASELLHVVGLRSSSRDLRRPIRRGKNFFELVKGGDSAEEAAAALVRILRIEAGQRAAMQKRFEGRKRPDSHATFEDFGVPTFNEEES